MSLAKPAAQTWPEPVRLPRYWSPAPNAADSSSASATSTNTSYSRPRRFRPVRLRVPGLLRSNRNFRRYFIGQSVSLLGDQISNIALPLTAVLALHATPGQMGAVLTVSLIPNLLFSLHTGVLIDRSGRRRQAMLVADALRGLVTL